MEGWLGRRFWAGVGKRYGKRGKGKGLKGTIMGGGWVLLGCKHSNV